MNCNQLQWFIVSCISSPLNHMQMDHSNESVVTIRNVKSRNTGKYRCEVSGEAPDFETDYREAHMSVVGIKNSSFNSCSTPKLVELAAKQIAADIFPSSFVWSCTI